jgi:hypothetical protein
MRTADADALRAAVADAPSQARVLRTADWIEEVYPLLIEDGKRLRERAEHAETLLRAYMQHVREAEGSTLLGYQASHTALTPEQCDELRTIDDAMHHRTPEQIAARRAYEAEMREVAEL